MPQRGEKEASRPQRWSAKQKTEVVLRLLRVEDLEEVSREIQVPAHVLEDWRRVFLKSGSQGLRRAGRHPAERELVRTRAKVGELAMKLELAERLLEKRGYGGRSQRPTRRSPSVTSKVYSVRLTRNRGAQT